MRFAAVLLILVAHGPDISASLPVVPSAVFLFVKAVGWIGVDLFFVLSGFLVSGLLFDEHARTGNLKVGRFLRRRGWRIIPPLYLLVFVTVGYAKWEGTSVSWTKVLHDVFFLQSYRQGLWTHEWTLAVEIHFYLLLALTLGLLSHRSKKSNFWLRRLPTILYGILLFCLVARLINSGCRDHFNYHHEMVPTHLHLDVLAAGVLLRYYYEGKVPFLAMLRSGKVVAVVFAFALLAPSAWLWVPHAFALTALMPTFNYLGFGILLYLIADSPFAISLWGRMLSAPGDFWGKHSYSIYLWHLPFKQWIIDREGTASGIESFLFFVGGSLLFGSAISVATETPLLRLRDLYFPTPEK